MNTGLVFGKFMPPHHGHLALVDFAAAHCQRVLVVLCVDPAEPIPGELRLQWLREIFANRREIEVIYLPYDPAILPNSSVSSREISRVWAAAFQAQLPPLDAVFTSEPYGDYLAEYMGIRHVLFDQPRLANPVSASQIRAQPWRYWEHLPGPVRPYFVTKIALHGTESTGKTTFAERLAAHYHTVHIPEMARDLIAQTVDVTPADLRRFAKAQADAIEAGAPLANRLLFIDTTAHTTQAYSRYLFAAEMPVEPRESAASTCALHLYLAADSPYVQDGTRLGVDRRLELDAVHRTFLAESGVHCVEIHGATWETRWERALNAVEAFLAPSLDG